VVRCQTPIQPSTFPAILPFQPGLQTDVIPHHKGAEREGAILAILLRFFGKDLLAKIDTNITKTLGRGRTKNGPVEERPSSFPRSPIG
jgi:hypothetical protein